MMTISTIPSIKFLISIDSKGKVRRIKIELVESPSDCTIHRESGIVGGKITNQPDIVITQGKAKRTLQEQGLLQYNHLISEYKNKGYKEIDYDPNSVSDISSLKDYFGEVKIDQNGFKKHMLAKQVKEINPAAIEAVEEWYVSRKIDGVRCSIYFNNNAIHSASRGGKNYDVITEVIRTHPKLIEFFNKHPDVVLDGELFKFGESLQTISGAARKQETESDIQLQYYIYDVQEDVPFVKRYQHLLQYKQELEIGDFDPNKNFVKGDLLIQFVPHVLVTGSDKLSQIWKLHDQYVSEGWEGCVARDANKPYKYGGRGIDMVKFKNYCDAEFKVIGYELGLRGSEDMVFIMEMTDGKTFKAKPWGTRKLKEQYYNNFETDYKGKMATCKFFAYSQDGIPLQPSLITFRDYE